MNLLLKLIVPHAWARNQYSLPTLIENNSVVCLQEDISPEINIRFGHESLTLDAWSIHHQYSALCTVMGPGMTSQLQENEFIREIFQLGARLTNTGINGNAKVKQTKLERVSGL